MDPTLLAEQHVLFDEAQQKPITVFASSGDSGASSRRTSFLMIGVSQSCRPRLRHSATVVIADPLAMSSKT